MLVPTSEIHIRDPFIYPCASEKAYYLFGTTDRQCWAGPGTGFDCYRSVDLAMWEGPMPAFRPTPGFWGTDQFWAPEVHAYRGRFYMFASFKAADRYRATHILVSERIVGPYAPLTDHPATPRDWECLDGTLHVDDRGMPWLVFCHEWVQVHNGAVYALPMTADLKQTAGRPVFLFNASEAPWVHRPPWPASKDARLFPTYVTDGPFLFRTRTGALLMLWSSAGEQGYAMGIARSQSNAVTGPWHHEAEPLWRRDGGHGMVFRHFDGRLFVTFHQPNKAPNERAVFREIEDLGDTLRLK